MSDGVSMEIVFGQNLGLIPWSSLKLSVLPLAK